MKKLLSKVLLIGIFSIFMISTVYGSESDIEIFFSVGDDLLTINGTEVEVETPFVENGTTLVPLRVITEAFGADVTWNGEEKSIVLAYDETEVKVVIGSKEATVDGESITMTEAPVIVNDTSMVPLRFITENFGADVSYDDETKQISVVKEVSINGSITDYSSLLKKTVKDSVGDSYAGWSMNLPDTLSIEERSFNGEYTYFYSDDGLYYLVVSIADQEDETLPSLLAELIDYTNYYTLIEQGIESDDEKEYARVVYKDTDWIYEDRVFIDNDKIYYTYIEVSDIDSYKESDFYTELLDSFDTTFVAGENIEDLSDVSEDGYRTYINTTIGWQVDVPANWDYIESYYKENEVEFEEIDGDTIYMEMFSIEDGLTLDSWVQDDLDLVEEKYNPDLVKVLEVKDLTVNDMAAKQVLTKADYGSITLYIWDVYVIGENYRYYYGYLMTEEHYNDSEMKARFERTLSSFIFEEPDVYEVGQLIDPDKIETFDEEAKALSSDDYNWSLEMPGEWIESYYHNGEDIVDISDENSQVSFQLGVNEDISLTEYLDYYDEIAIPQAEATGSFSNITDDKIVKFNTTVYVYEYDYETYGLTYHQTVYFFEKNGVFYSAIKKISDLYSSEHNLEVLESVWESLEIK